MKLCKNDFEDYKSINVLEDETEWNINDVYQYADERRDGHYIYKYAGDNDTNTELSPSVIYERDKEIYPIWVQIAPTNYYAMLDARTDSQTTQANDIVMTFDIQNQDTFSLLNLKAVSVTLSLYDNSLGAISYTNNVVTQDESSVIDFYSYCFNEFVYTDSVYIDDIPLTQDGVLTVTIDGDSVGVGRLVIGKSIFIGDTDYGVSLGIESYSRRDIDTFGNVNLKQRGSVNIDTYSIKVPTSKVIELRSTAKKYDAIPLLFIGDESEDTIVENLLNFGYWTSFNMVLPNPVNSTLSLSIKGIL